MGGDRGMKCDRHRAIRRLEGDKAFVEIAAKGGARDAAAVFQAARAGIDHPFAQQGVVAEAIRAVMTDAEMAGHRIGKEDVFVLCARPNSVQDQGCAGDRQAVGVSGRPECRIGRDVGLPVTVHRQLQITPQPSRRARITTSVQTPRSRGISPPGKTSRHRMDHIVV